MSTHSAAAGSAADHAHDVVIVVNGTEFSVESETVTYDQLVNIAYPTPPDSDSRFTVSYRHAREPKEGSLASGQSVEVKKRGTIFNVKPTGRS